MKAFHHTLLGTLLVQILAWRSIVSVEVAIEHGTSRSQQGQGLAQALEGRGNHGGIREHDDPQGMGAGLGPGEKDDGCGGCGQVQCYVRGGGYSVKTGWCRLLR